MVTLASFTRFLEVVGAKSDKGAGRKQGKLCQALSIGPSVMFLYR